MIRFCVFMLNNTTSFHFALFILKIRRKMRGSEWEEWPVNEKYLFPHSAGVMLFVAWLFKKNGNSFLV